jgi:carboxymethylenebutenolidase
MATITIETDDGSFSAYVAYPKGASAEQPKPGLLVIQEIFGVNKVMRDICDHYAAEGYVAICPDIFWRQEPGVDITDKSKEEWDKAFQLLQGFNEVKGVEDLIATLDALRELPECTGKAGSIGFCLGGKLAFLMATRSDSDCNVSYYGVALDEKLDEVSAITRPLLMHVAEKDKFVPPEAREKILRAVNENPMVEAHVYDGLDHAFARVGGEHYDEHGAGVANARTAAFLENHLNQI